MERYFSLIGGKKYKAALTTLEEVKLRDAVVRDLQVGVAQVFPDTTLVDGSLGSDFLAHLKFTLDRQKSELSLSPFVETKEMPKEKKRFD